MRYDYSEYTEYEAPDGLVFLLHNPPNRIVVSETGMGLPPLDYITQRGPLQHGETVVGVFLKPRIIQLVIRHQFCSRDSYWNGRAALLADIHPNRGGVLTLPPPGHLRKYLSTGQIRQVDCYLIEGPAFQPRNVSVWDEWAFNEVLRFEAFNPVVYDPTRHMQSIPTSAAQLVYPITFPITYGSNIYTTIISYHGSWIEYPTIILTGQMENPIITHTDLNLKLGLNYNIVFGETVTYDLSYSACRVTSTLNGDLTQYLTDDTDFTSFHLADEPAVTSGNNHITVSAESTGASSSVEFLWYERFIGA